MPPSFARAFDQPHHRPVRRLLLRPFKLIAGVR